MYATRRRKRNTRKTAGASQAHTNANLIAAAAAAVGIKPTSQSRLGQAMPGDLIPPNAQTAAMLAAAAVRSNPSKRHRERLNIELEALAELLPFDPNIVQKLDKLSILRLASSYLKAKCYLRTAAQSCPDLSEQLPFYYMMDEPVQQLDGFLLVVTTDGELFYASSNVEMYLGFHQSDILHQSVLEFIHSEDRDMFKEQLEWKHRPKRHEALSTPRRAPQQGNDFYLQRSFTARFRCLLDNTSGFVTMDVTGRLQPFPPGFPQSLTGGNNLAAASAGIRTRPSPSSTSNSANSATPPTASSGPSQPSLALFAYCQPFGPGAFPVAAGQIDLSKTFKSKHALDFSFQSVDPRVRQVIDGSDENEFFQKPFYDMVHLPDLNYVATAHAELMKRGSCGLLAYRIVNPNLTSGGLVWLQTSARIISRSGKPDHILCIHRRLTDDEGDGLVSKRASEFRLPCALFDVVDAASSVRQSGVAEPSVQDNDSNSRFEPPASKKPKISTSKRVTKKATKSAQLLSSNQTMPAALPGQISAEGNAVMAGQFRQDSAWPSAYPNLYPSNAGYYSSDQLQPAAFGFQSQPSSFASYPSEALANYYNYSAYASMASAYNSEDFAANLMNNSCVYGVGTPPVAPWNLGSNEKILSHNDYRLMYEAQETVQAPVVSTVGPSDSSPSGQSLGGGTSDESPTTTSVIRHTGGQFGNSIQIPGYYGDYSATPGYSTPVSTTTIQGNSNHPTIYQAQQVYAATPATQFLS